MIVKKIGKKGGKNQNWAWNHRKSQRVTNREIRERTLISPFEMELERGLRKKIERKEHLHMVNIDFESYIAYIPVLFYGNNYNLKFYQIDCLWTF